MDSLSISLELAQIRENTRRLALWSLIAHAAAVILFLVSASQPHPVAAETYVITEVFWPESAEEIAPTPVELVVAQSEPQPVHPSVVMVEEKPEPVMPARDSHLELVQQRLAALRVDDDGRRTITSAAAAPTRQRPNGAALGAMVPSQTGPTRELNRAVVRPVNHVSELPKERPSVVTAAVTALPKDDTVTTTAQAEEILPGISLAGQVSDRRLIDYATPDYPEWAKRDGVEVTVELYFTVLPSGQVKENVFIERTSGFEDFDSRAKSALLSWRFESLDSGSAGEQWGRIEFKYRLRDAG